MNIAIIGSSEKKRIELESLIFSISNRTEGFNIVCYDLSEQEKIPVSNSVSVAFIFVENSKILHRIKELRDLRKDLSIIIVSNHPKYALESIRLDTKYYILFPFEKSEVEESLRRSGVIL